MEHHDGPTASLPDRLRAAFGARTTGGAEEDDPAVDRVEDALSALEALLRLGWVAPDRVDDLLTTVPEAPTGPGVRSLAEDLAVAKLRARTAGERSRGEVARARTVVARSEELAADAARRAARSDSRRAGRAALEEEVAQLRTALANRPRIEHAVGIVMGALACDETTAWQALSELSQFTNVKLRDLSGVLVDRVGTGQGVPPDVLAALRVIAAGGRLGPTGKSSRRD